jgi:hypothetical protein
MPLRGGGLPKHWSLPSNSLSTESGQLQSSGLGATHRRMALAGMGRHRPLSSLAQWAQRLYERTLRDQIPTTYVAVEQRQPVGSVTLVEHDMEIRVDLSPWLAGVYVRPLAPAGRGQYARAACALAGSPPGLCGALPLYPSCPPVLRALRLGSPRGNDLPRTPSYDHAVLIDVSCAPSPAHICLNCYQSSRQIQAPGVMLPRLAERLAQARELLRQH